MGIILKAPGYLIWIVGATWGTILCFEILYRAFGAVFAVISFIAFPLFLGLAPLYAGFSTGKWFPMVLLYGGAISGMILIAIGSSIDKADLVSINRGAPQDNASSQFSAVPNFIKLQLTMTGKDLTIFNDDNFALGYVFGMADMEYFQKDVSFDDQGKALTFILTVFNEIFGDTASALISKSIQEQKLPLFVLGRNDVPLDL